MKRWVRQHRYAIRVALRRLLAQPFSSLSNIMVISLALAIPILAASVLISVEPLARAIPVNPEITLFLDPQAPASQADKLAAQLRTDHASVVGSARVVTRAQALGRLKDNPAWRDALAVLPGNPLPDAVVVTLADTADSSGVAAELAQQWRKLDNVDAVQLDSDWVRRLEALLGFARIGLALLAGAVALMVLATVFNTVRLQALTQREEIGVARLVGATESFVRRPFLYLGAISGIIASLIAIGLAALALAPLNTALARLASSYGAEFAVRLPDPASLLLATILVAILGALSARWSVNRTTRF
ncbi:FtsX-like permease family protein [Pusillimonas sp. TS35]|uniref:cell division protein FtsX n=1 Tax=Paracandidimonas lactea TaxID=2895524 RepID=UPI0013708E07|nr:ABC transporter permease [Paracandidimonas lactea]MYN14044.1 FtsX-like permease family protein [Pusillimonas sp. TS35]